MSSLATPNPEQLFSHDSRPIHPAQLALTTPMSRLMLKRSLTSSLEVARSIYVHIVAASDSHSILRHPPSFYAFNLNHTYTSRPSP